MILKVKRDVSSILLSPNMSLLSPWFVNKGFFFSYTDFFCICVAVFN